MYLVGGMHAERAGSQLKFLDKTVAVPTNYDAYVVSTGYLQLPTYLVLYLTVKRYSYSTVGRC